MTIRDCLNTAAAGGELAKEDVDALVKRHRQLELELGDAGAAKLRLAEELEKEALQRKRAALLARQTQSRLAGEIFNFKNARGENDVAAYLRGVLERFGEATGIKVSVEGRRKAIVGMAHAEFEAALYEFRRTWWTGRRVNKAGLQNVVRELHGQDTGDVAAKGFAAAWSRISDQLRERFNAAGGAIGFLEKWGLPQSHDRRALRNAGFETWRNFILPRLDPARMRHPIHGGAMTQGELMTSLRHVYESVTMEGWNTRQPSMQPAGRGALYTQHADHRFLVFKSADDWMAYSREFGRGGDDPFQIMMTHINTMARDIAAMEVLGPNPSATLGWLQQIVEKEAGRQNAGLPARFPTRHPGTGLPINAPDYAASAIKRSSEMFDYMRGAANVPVLTLAANVMETARNTNIAAKLGSAVWSAMSDQGFQAVSRKFAGLSVNGQIGEVLAQFKTANQREAVRAGLILESAMHGLGERARYVGTLAGAEWSRYIADRTLHITGLSPVTQANRHAFGMAFLAETADRVHLDFAGLPPQFREAFERYGLSAADWDVMRKAQLHEPQPGATFLRPQEIAQTNRDVAERYLEMILSETEYAVPSGSVRASTALVTDRPGTFWNSVSRSFAMFKTFGVLAVMLHGGRIARDLIGGNIARGAAYAGGMLAMTSILGALTIQMRSIQQGRDPRPMDTKFWGAAILQGGGLGIFGDFLFADVSRNGKGWSDIIAGPVIGMVDDVRRLALRSPMNAIEGDKTNFGRDSVNLIRSYMPGGSIWYTRLAWERLVLDQLQWAVDPEAHQAFRRKEQHLARTMGSQYWWRPGETSARRAPNLDNALSSRR